MSNPSTASMQTVSATRFSDAPLQTAIAAARDYSVIIPCFNGSDTLERAILSARRQNVAPFEIIVIDDGSRDTDASAAIVARHAPLVRLLAQDNRGPGAARNAGARLASSTWLAFLDADDSWHINKMARQLDLATDGGIGLLLDSGGMPGRPSPTAPTFDDFWQRNWVRTSAAVVRRTAFMSIDGFDEDSELIGAEDYNLWLRLSAAGWKAKADSKILITYSPAAACISSQIERCARGELNNVRKLQTQLGLNVRQARRKHLEIRVAFGRDLLHHRNISAARSMLAAPAIRAMPEAVQLWLATFIPVSLLDFRSKLRGRRMSAVARAAQ